MSVLEFISNLIDNLLSWPVILAALLLFFRRPIASLLQRVSEWEGFGQKIKFGKELAEVEQKIDQALENADIGGQLDYVDLPPDAHPPGDIGSSRPPAPPEERAARAARPPSSFWERLAFEADSSPSSTVLMAWRTLETTILGLAQGLSGQPSAGSNVQAALPVLQEAGYVSKELIAAVEQLQRLRNAVAHGEHDPTPGEASAYVEQARQLNTLVQILSYENGNAGSPSDAQADR
jgi:hypothetical protein